MQPQKRLCSSPRGEKFSCVWWPAVFAARASNFPKWGEGARIPARAGAHSRAPKAGRFTSVARHFFSSFFRLIFAAFALALIAGGKRDPARPCGTAHVPPRLFRRLGRGRGQRRGGSTYGKPVGFCGSAGKGRPQARRCEASPWRAKPARGRRRRPRPAAAQPTLRLLRGFSGGKSAFSPVIAI